MKVFLSFPYCALYTLSTHMQLGQARKRAKRSQGRATAGSDHSLYCSLGILILNSPASAVSALLKTLIVRAAFGNCHAAHHCAAVPAVPAALETKDSSRSFWKLRKLRITAPQLPQFPQR